MINADFSRCDDRFLLTVNGHAGYSRSGDDIICAAVSGIVYALVGYLANECEGVRISALRQGLASVECGSDGDAAMRMAYIGLLQLAITYPDFVRVRCDAWRLKVGTARELLV